MTHRVAVVTGAASGIGRATAELFLGQGDLVVAVDQSDSGLDALDPTACVTVVGDITSDHVNRAMVAAALQQWGRLDVLVLNAGMPGSGAIDTLDLAVFDRVLEVNLRSVVLGLRAAIPVMRAAGGGSVVVTASTSALGGEPRRWPYNAAKAGVVNLVRSAAIDLALDGIRINAVCPGPTHSGMTGALAGTPRYEDLRRMIPLQRWAEAHEVAAAIGFLASPAASFITGVALPVDGGITAGNGQNLPPQRS